MIKVIIPTDQEKTIVFQDIQKDKPIIAKRYGKIAGIIIREQEGYRLMISAEQGSNGHHESIEECMLSNIKFGYEFFVED